MNSVIFRYNQNWRMLCMKILIWFPAEIPTWPSYCWLKLLSTLLQHLSGSTYWNTVSQTTNSLRSRGLVQVLQHHSGDMNLAAFCDPIPPLLHIIPWPLSTIPINKSGSISFTWRQCSINFSHTKPLIPSIPNTIIQITVQDPYKWVIIFVSKVKIHLSGGKW